MNLFGTQNLLLIVNKIKNKIIRKTVSHHYFVRQNPKNIQIKKCMDLSTLNTR